MITLSKLRSLARKNRFILGVWVRSPHTTLVSVWKGPNVNQSQWRKIRKQLKEAKFLFVRRQNTDPGWYCNWNHKKGEWEPIKFCP